MYIKHRCAICCNHWASYHILRLVIIMYVRTYVRTYSGTRIFAHTNVCAYVRNYMLEYVVYVMYVCTLVAFEECYRVYCACHDNVTRQAHTPQLVLVYQTVLGASTFALTVATITRVIHQELARLNGGSALGISMLVAQSTC